MKTVVEIELHNVKVARILVDYWRRQGVEISLNFHRLRHGSSANELGRAAVRETSTRTFFSGQ